MRTLFASSMVLLVLAALTIGSIDAQAAPPPQSNSSAEDCLACHDAETMVIRLPNGDPINMVVDGVGFAGSVHGEAGLTCTDCHQNYDGYPHAQNLYGSRRDFEIDHYTVCQSCHEDQYTAHLDSMHQRALAAGREDAPVCTDCHDPHQTAPPDDPPNRIPRTCGTCHTAIYSRYEESVHGAALLDDFNPDVPTCVDCHGVHDIGDPLTAQFRLESPEICASCHADPERMAPYGISTDVVRTYVNDFHGTTVSLARQEDGPGTPVEQAVCFDCHGIHDIQAVDDPDSPVIRERLLQTCRECHPNASEHFVGAWASHYIPSPEHNRFVFTVQNFYTTLLPLTGLIVIGVVGGDTVRWLWRSLRKQGGE